MIKSLFLLLMLSACYQWALIAQDGVDQLLADANKHIERKEYNEALQSVNEALVLWPQHLAALEKKVNILYLQDNLKEAMVLADHMLSKDPIKPEFYYLRAITYMLREKYVKALEDFDKCEELRMPQELKDKVYINRGMAHFRLNEFTVAGENFTKAIEINPDNSAAYHSRGMLHYELKDYTEALEDFNIAYQIEEDNTITAFNIGMSHFRLKQFENACFYFNKSCSSGNRNACKMLMMECAQELKLSQ